MTELHVYCREGDLQGVQRLLQHNINFNDPDELDEDGQTPLHYASANGYVDIVQEFINYDMIHDKNIINQKDDYGNVPLHLASFNRELEVLKVLLSYADRFIKNNDGDTPFDIAKHEKILFGGDRTEEIRDLIKMEFGFKIILKPNLIIIMIH